MSYRCQVPGISRYCQCVICRRARADTGCWCPSCYDYKHLIAARWGGKWRTQYELDHIGCETGPSMVSDAYLREGGTECRDCGCLEAIGTTLLHAHCYRDRELYTLWKMPAGPALSYDGKTWEPVLK